MVAPTRSVANGERPAHIPVKPMGSIAVIVHVVWSDGGEEWRPARAIRWTPTHVMVGWLEEPPDAARRAARAAATSHDERWEWFRAQDVMRSVRWLVPPPNG